MLLKKGDQGGAERAAAVRLLARMHENLPLVRDELSNPDDA